MTDGGGRVWAWVSAWDQEHHTTAHAAGQNYVVLNPDVLSNPRHHCQLTYRLDGQCIVIEKQPGIAWMEIDTAAL